MRNNPSSIAQLRARNFRQTLPKRLRYLRKTRFHTLRISNFADRRQPFSLYFGSQNRTLFPVGEIQKTPSYPYFNPISGIAHGINWNNSVHETQTESRQKSPHPNRNRYTQNAKNKSILITKMSPLMPWCFSLKVIPVGVRGFLGENKIVIPVGVRGHSFMPCTNIYMCSTIINY